MGKRIAAIHERILFWLIAPVVPAVLVLMGLALNIDQFADTPQQAELYPHYSAWLVSAAVIMLSGLLAGMLLLWRAKKPFAVLVMALSYLLAAQIGLSGYNTIARERSAKHIAEAIRPYVRPDIPFYSVLTYEQTLPFYLKRTFTLVQYQDEMGFGIQQEPQRWIPTLDEFAKVWAAQPEALAIMQVYAFEVLQQRVASTGSGQELAMKIIFEDSQHIVVSKP